MGWEISSARARIDDANASPPRLHSLFCRNATLRRPGITCLLSQPDIINTHRQDSTYIISVASERMPEPIASDLIDLLVTMARVCNCIKHLGKMICMFSGRLYFLASLLLPYLRSHLSAEAILVLKLVYILVLVFLTSQVTITGWNLLRVITSLLFHMSLATRPLSSVPR